MLPTKTVEHAPCGEPFHKTNSISEAQTDLCSGCQQGQKFNTLPLDCEVRNQVNKVIILSRQIITVN